MKNLKRVLALTLAVVLVLSMSVSALAFTDDTAITHNQAVNVLSELNVIAGYPDGSFRPNDPVTRAEMAKMITVILNKGVDDPTQFESGVTDLTDISWNWGKSYITYCYILNIIAGYGDGTFRPEDNVTVQEAAKMILVALGFDVTQEGLEGINWAVNANSLANQFDIYTGVTQSVNEAATRDTIAQMLYNMIKANTVSYNVNIYTGISTRLTDEKALSKYFNCELLNGMIVANEYASLWYSVPLMAGRTELLYFEDDAIENGIFDIAKSNYRNYDFQNWVTDTLNVSTGQDELGLWVTVIRNQTTKKIVGGVMLNNDLMTTIEGGNGNFLDAIKAAGLRLTDGKYTVIVNGQVFKWESNDEIPEAANHPLASYAENGGTVTATSARYNAYLGKVLTNVFGTEFKDMNGMTFRAVELNGDNYVDVVYVEAETLTQVTKVETKGGAKEYTFANLNVSLNTGELASDATKYTAQSVKEADIVTDATLGVDDYVLVRQVNETYYVSKVVFEDLTVSSKSATAKTLTLKDKDSASTTYKLSDIPVAYAIWDDANVYKKLNNNTSTDLVNMVTGNKYAFGFDSAGNVVMAKKADAKTDYALLNGMATTYGTNYTAQLLLEDGVTVSGGVGDFLKFSTPVVDRWSRTEPADFLASARNGSTNISASSYPALVSYKEDGSDYNITYEVDDSETGGLNRFIGGSSIYLDTGNRAAYYRITANTVMFYRIADADGKVKYSVYTDYTKAPTFDGTNVDVYVATANNSTTNGAIAEAVFVSGISGVGGNIEDATSQNYIYITKVTDTGYDGKQSKVTGFTIDKNFNVKTLTEDMIFNKVLEDNTTSGKLYTYTTTSTADVYELGKAESTYTLTTVNDKYVEWGAGSNQFATYSSTLTNMYRYKEPGDRYDRLTGNFTNNKNLLKGDVVYMVKDESNVAVFIMNTGNNVPYYVDSDAPVVTAVAGQGGSYFAYNNSGSYIAQTFNASTYALTGTATIGTSKYTDGDGIQSANTPEGALSISGFDYVTITLEKTVVTDNWSDGSTVDNVSYAYVATSVASAPDYADLTNTYGPLVAGAVAADTGMTADDYSLTTGTVTIGLGGSGSDQWVPGAGALGYVIDATTGTVSALSSVTANSGVTYAGGSFYCNGTGTTAVDGTSYGGGTYTFALLIYAS